MIEANDVYELIV